MNKSGKYFSCYRKSTSHFRPKNAYIHPEDRFDIDHPVFSLDPAFEESIEVFKVLYALEN